ncbi:hypothetical protein YC2023_019467 [Brassica napus]
MNLSFLLLISFYHFFLYNVASQQGFWQTIYKLFSLPVTYLSSNLAKFTQELCITNSFFRVDPSKLRDHLLRLCLPVLRIHNRIFSLGSIYPGFQSQC